MHHALVVSQVERSKERFLGINVRQGMYVAMDNKSIVWVASYPRSGNTFLRTVLWQCFGLRSASIYPMDLGGNKQLEEYVGHIEHGRDHKIKFPDNAIPLLKTHEHQSDNAPAIYIVRDGRAACVSLAKFYKNLKLKNVVEGRHQFGPWSNHVKSWHPWNRPNTLLLRYEDMLNDLPAAVESIGEYLDMNPTCDRITHREKIAGSDGRWVKKKSNWQSELNGGLLKKFNSANREVLMKTGYM